MFGNRARRETVCAMPQLDENTLLDRLAPSDAELSAFTLLEKARLRCERLVGDGGVQAALGAIHRDIGLAGYQVSAEFRPALRLQRLALARSKLESSPDRVPWIPLQTLFVDVISACDAIADALSFSSSDHLHLAHLHAMSAAQGLNVQIVASASPGA